MKLIVKIAFVLILIFFFFCCKKEEFITEGSAKLEFSTDTIIFDTVFTTIGSVTQQVKVYNRHKQKINVSRIYLGGGNQSAFRLNINGMASSEGKDLVIQAEDSLFIFVEVTVDPNNENMPLVIEDSLVFLTNGNIQDIPLVAWGQDAHIFNRAIIGSQTWQNDKPYLIYNYVYVDTLQTLTVNAGTKIHFHRNSGLILQGRIVVNGTLDDPVIFQGDRLEQDYKDIPGQWGGIQLLWGSINNQIRYAEIKNAIVGIQVGAGSVQKIQPASLSLYNTIILNMTYAGIYSIASSIFAENCVIANCGYHTLELLVGGNYEFYHCSIANFYGYSNRTTPSVLITNNAKFYETLFFGDLNNAYFGNCIIYGNRENELALGKDKSVKFNCKFDNSLLRLDTKEWDVSDTTFFRDIFYNFDPSFKSVTDKYDFQLDTLSAVKDKGKISIANLIPLDFRGVNRITNDGLPDLGAYEREE